MKRNLFLTARGSALLCTATTFAQTDTDIFYKSNMVNMEKVSFPNQYRMKATGDLFCLKTDSTHHHPPTFTSNVKFINFYPISDIETISPRPLLFIAGENAHSREFSEDAYRLETEPKELYIVPSAGHVDLYDRTRLIPFDKLESFFKIHLK